MLLLVGVGVTVVGWAFMLFGVGSEAGFSGIEVANVHKMQIAQAMIHGGYAAVIAGVIKEGFASVLEKMPMREGSSMTKARTQDEHYRNGQDDHTARARNAIRKFAAETETGVSHTEADIADLKQRLKAASERLASESS